MLFGQKVTKTFRDRVQWIANDLDLPADDLMCCMAWESGRTFSASVRNAAGSGAVGLIQFMPQTAAALGTSTPHLASMSPEDQLNYVWKYFAPYKGRLHNLGDIYMAILWPAAIGKPDSYVLFDRDTGPHAYAQNKGLDFNHDGRITRAEAYQRVAALRSEGQALAA